jgi:ADP-heptose:LPS heptosyltransferase
MVCADGGLWHVGCALGVPSVVLFADTRLFDAHGRHVCRDTDDLRAEALHHWTAVSEIAPEEVLAAFERL